MAKTRLAKIVLTIKGVWSPTVEYEKLDLVNYLGSSYIAKRDNIGVTPVEGDDWSLSAEKGGKGDKGDQGDKIYLHIAYANSGDGETDFTTSPVSGKVYTYLGSYSDYTPEDSNVPSTYVWSKLTEEAERAAAELLRVAAEEERVAAETARVSAESQRDSAESARNAAEETRVSNEQSRVSAEINRVSGESARQSAETARVSSETDRQEAEVSRVDEEKRRVSAETDRVNAETNRLEGEQHRVSAEQSRSDAETVRVNNESARNTAEETRVSDESARKTAETSRVSAENTRDTSETKRVNAEISRATAETARVNAEDVRVLAEQGRVSAESGRVSAEQGRVSAETERVTAETERAATFSGYQNEINQFKNDIVTSKDAATENTKFAIGTAEQTLEVPSMEEINAVKDDVASITPDDSTVDGKPWTSRKIVDTLCPPFDVSGSVVTCHPVEGYPLGVVSRIDAVQDGTGDPSPDNVRAIAGWDAVTLTRCGKNLIGDYSNMFPYTQNGVTLTLNDDKSITVTGTPTITSGYLYTVYLMRENPNFIDGVKYILKNVTCILNLRDGSKKYVSDYFTFDRSTVKSVDIYIQIKVQNYIDGMTIYPMICTEGTDTTAYEPYRCDTYTAELPETVYGGTLDWATGMLTVEYAIKTFNGTETIILGQQGGNPRFSTNINHSADNGVGVCSHMVTSYTPIGSNSKNNTIAPHKSGVAIWRFDACETVGAMVDYFKAQYDAGTPVQLAYKLLTPYTIQLTPQQILAISGTNTLYTDSGDTTVSGPTDPVWLTQTLVDRIAALESATISLGGNV